jgi:outer membrane protein TolC
MNRLNVSALAILVAAGPSLAAAPADPPAPRENGAREVSVRDEAGPREHFTLAEAIARAREQSPRLAQLRALESAADAGVAGAKAQRMPSLDLVASYARNSRIPEFVLPPPIGVTVFEDIPDNWRTRLLVTAPVYTGRRIESGIAAASSERDAAASETRTGLDDLTLETTAAYWSLVTARESAKVVADALGTFDAHLADARNRERFGMAARNEVLAVEVERDRAQLAALEADNAAEVANANLVRLLGLPPETRIAAAESLETAEALRESIEKLVQEALAVRPERAALAARLSAAEARVEAERSSRYPQVSAAAGYDYASPNPHYLPPQDAWKSSWNVGVGLSLSVLDGGRTRAAVAQATAQADAIRRQIDDLDRRIRLDVTARLLDVRTAGAAVAVASRSLASAEENRKVSADRYRAGVGLSSDLLDAETGLLRAGLERTAAFAGLRLALASLDRSAGR